MSRLNPTLTGFVILSITQKEERTECSIGLNPTLTGFVILSSKKF